MAKGKKRTAEQRPVAEAKPTSEATEAKSAPTPAKEREFRAARIFVQHEPVLSVGSHFPVGFVREEGIQENSQVQRIAVLPNGALVIETTDKRKIEFHCDYAVEE